jgi:hypothetical protein
VLATALFGVGAVIGVAVLLASEIGRRAKRVLAGSSAREAA